MTGKSMTMRAQLTMKTGVLAGGAQPGSHISGRQRQRLSSMTKPTETNFARLQARADQLWQANPRLSKTQVGRILRAEYGVNAHEVARKLEKPTPVQPAG